MSNRVFRIAILVSLVACLFSMGPASFLLYYFASPSDKQKRIYYFMNIFIPFFLDYCYCPILNFYNAFSLSIARKRYALTCE